MTLTTRNTILFILLVLTIAIAFLVAFSGYLYRPGSIDESEVSAELTSSHRYLFFRWEQPSVDIGTIFVALSIGSSLSIIGIILVLRYFRRTNAPEVFLFALFLVCLSGDNLKLAIPLLTVLDQPALYGVVVTRVVQFCHLFGVFCLFASTLFASGIDYQRLGNVTIVAFIVALAMTYTMPVDSDTLFPSLVYQMGDQITLQLLVAALAVLSVINVGSASLVHGSDGFAVYAPAVVLMFIGRELLFLFAGLAVSLIGGALLFGGAVTYGVKKYLDYLWS